MRINTKYVAMYTLAALVVIGLGYVAMKKKPSREATVSSSPIKIGALIPLTGKFANIGEDIRNAMKIAQEEIRTNEGVLFDIIYEDSAAEAKIALPAANKLVDINNVPLIIAGPGSSANLAVAPIMEQRRTIFMAISSTPKLNDAGQYIFKVHPDIDAEVNRMAVFVHQKGYRRIAILFDAASDTQVTGKDLFVEKFKVLDGEVVVAEGYDSKTVTDFRTQLTTIKSRKPDSLYVLALEKVAGLAVKQARELGFAQPIFGWSPFDSDEFFRGAGSAAEGVVITAQPFSCSGTLIMQTYCQRYTERFPGRTPLQYGAHAYDLLYILSRVIREDQLVQHWNEQTTREQLIKQLLRVQHNEGVSGDITFDDQGNVRDKTFEFRIAMDGKFKKLNE